MSKRYNRAISKKDEKWQHKVIKTRSELKDWLMYEKKIYAEELSFSGGGVCLTEKDHIYKYQKRLRKTEYFLNSKKYFRYIISRILLQNLSVKYGLNIRLNSCGRGLHIVHLSSVITNGDIGENYTAFPNTLVGQSGGRTPTVGNNVVAYTGATIVGEIVIADGVCIGANSFVNKNVDIEGACVGGVPARILEHKNH